MKRRDLLLSSLALPLAAAVGSVAAREGWPSSLTIATASVGGVYAIYGQGVATLIGEVVGLPTSTRQTQGPVQNLVLVDSGDTELGMTTTGPAWEAWNGQSPLAPGRPLRNVRALFPMYETPFQAIALARSGIRSVRDLEGRVVGAGPRGGTGGTYWPRWLEVLGISCELRFGPIGDQASQLADGRLDAIVTAGGIPHPSFQELETTHEVVVFSLDPADIDRLVAEHPYVSRFVIPAGTYRSLAADLETVAMWNFFIGHADLPEDLVHAIVDAVFAHHERLVQVHSAARATRPENIVHDTFLWLHPGALRWYREHGIEVPAGAVPA